MGSRNRSARRQIRQALQQANRHVPPGTLNSRSNGKSHEQILVEELLINASMARQDWMNNQIDPRRDVNDECGYPETITVNVCKQLYDRDSIAARVVQVFPRECWGMQPTIYEDEDSEVVTTFEQAWDTLGKNLLGEDSKFKQEHGNPIWEYFKRLDTLAGIGTFGIMLMGFDDGLPPWMPVAGFEDGLPSVPDDPKQRQDAEQMNGSAQSTEGGRVDSSPMGTDAQYYDYFGYKEYDGPAPQSKSKKKPTTPKNPITGNFGGPPAPAPTPHNPYLGPKEYEDEKEQSEAGGEEEQTNDQGMEEGSEQQFGQDDSETVVGAESEQAPEFTPKVKLLYLRCFDESAVQVVQYESDQFSPRFGQPVRYLIQLNDPRTQHGGIGLPMNSIYVHWSRVLHFTDTHWQENSSEVFAPMRLECVFNRVWDLYKTYSGDAEAYWRGAFPSLSIETHPSLGGDVVVDKTSLRNMMENRNNGMQRDIFLMGMAAKTLPPQVVDPTAHIEVQLTAICIKIGIPKRIFMGSERGELASGQDDSTWNDRVAERQSNLLTPRMLVPFVDRMVRVGCLPEPQGYCVEWPDLNAASDKEKADIAKARFEALTSYVQGNLESLITPIDALSKIGLMVTEDEAKAMLDSAADAIEDRMTADPNDMMQQQLEQQGELGQAAIEAGLNPAGETTQIGDTHEHIYPEGSEAGVQQPQPEQGPPQQDDGSIPQKQGAMPPAKGPIPPKKKPPMPPMQNRFANFGRGLVENCGGEGSGIPGPCPGGGSQESDAMEDGYLESYGDAPEYIRTAMTSSEYMAHQMFTSLRNQANRKPYRPLSPEQIKHMKDSGWIKNKANKVTDAGKLERNRLQSKYDQAEAADIQREFDKINKTDNSNHIPSADVEEE